MEDWSIRNPNIEIRNKCEFEIQESKTLQSVMLSKAKHLLFAVQIKQILRLPSE